MSIFPRLRCFRILSYLVPILILAVSLAGQRPSKNTSLQFYALAATPGGEGEYPATLYRVDEYKRLDMVRVVVPQQQGSDYVRASGNVIVFPYPNGSPTSIAIVHTDDPTREDNVVFRSSGVPGTPPMDLAEPPGSGLEDS